MKSCFEIIAYSHGADDRSELGARLRGAFEEFVDIRAMTDDEAAKRIKADRIDILVELKGYTKGARTGISSALWAGLPVMTCAGDTFAGRVAGSLLQAVGLPELVTFSAAAYEALGLRLVQEPTLLQGLRHKLLGNRLNAPLFDIARYTRHYEAALTLMWETWANGHEPMGFAVPPSLRNGAPVLSPPPIERIAYLACPLCERSYIPAVLGADCSKHPIYQPGLPPVMNWHECRACGHVFTEGYFDANAAALVFSKTQPNQTVGYDMERQRPVSARMVERVARYAQGGSWLDVGFGNGSLLFTAEEWGYVPAELDLRKDNVHALKQLGYEAHCVPVEELDYRERFNVISTADVLEHMPFPKAGLAATHRLLRQGGVLFLSMPNMENMVWRLLHANKVNPYWGEIEHYHNFSRKRLYALLQEHGFEPVEYHVSERYRVCMEVIAVKR
jgi:protein O-GlcNAc transferase